jgi:hypothetical protein
VSRVNIVKRIKIDGLWKMFSIARNVRGNYDWNAIADGRYYVELVRGRHTSSRGRRRKSAVRESRSSRKARSVQSRAAEK